MAILEAFPDKTVAGDTLRVLRSYSDYPVGTWTAIFYIENKDGTSHIHATTSGNSFLFTMVALTSADIVPGRYKWLVRVTDGTIKETAEEGWIEFQVDPAAAGNADRRSDARKMYDALNATLLGKATADQSAMSINGRSISRIPLIELRQWRDQLRQEVRTEEQGERAGIGRIIKTRVTRG